jgi:hypothetical protein
MLITKRNWQHFLEPKNNPIISPRLPASMALQIDCKGFNISQ